MAKYLADFTGLYDQGRHAVYWAFRGLSPTESTLAWLPSFHCGVEVEAATAAGFEVGFYRVKEDLQADLDDLDRKLQSRPGPVLVIHYFGFPQPEIRRMAELCRKSGVALIEDCTHALFSMAESVPLGNFGPIAVFSLAKTLGLYSGGALKVNMSMFESWVGRGFVTPPKTRPAPGTYLILFKDCIRQLVGPGMTNLYRRLRYGPSAQDQDKDKSRAATRDEEVVFQRQRPNYKTGMAWVSRQVARKASPVQISGCRRANYGMLAALLRDTQGIRPVFPHLSEGICPLVFPVWVEHRDELENRLRQRGIHCYVFGLWRHPLLPGGLYPETRLARRHILGLPVQQYLGRSHMALVAREVSRQSEDL